MSIARVYVIGDIHGRTDLLDQMTDLIAEDVGRYDAAKCLTVTLGDYIDRGPNSRGVIERLSRNPFPTQYIALRGNHEAMVEEFLTEPTSVQRWRRFGGLDTLHSYGVPTRDLANGTGFEVAARAFDTVMPKAHRQFLASLKPCFVFDGNYLCHAGVRPHVPLDQQKLEDLLWIRDEFLDSDVIFDKLIIHGHSPCEWPEIRRNRINIDTKAFASGRLTCLVLEGEEKRFLYTG